MIGSFWNLCRACPSMPVDKVNVFINFLIATALCCYTDVWRGHHNFYGNSHFSLYIEYGIATAYTP